MSLFPTSADKYNEASRRYNEQLKRQELVDLMMETIRTLEFYADDNNYVNVPVGYELMTKVEMDAGTTAQAMLDKLRAYVENER